MCSIVAKKRLDNIWNYFRMENPLFEILKKYFDVNDSNKWQ